MNTKSFLSDMIHVFPPGALEVNCEGMTLRRTRNLLMMVILLDFTNDIWMLPAPSRVSMDSVNLRHMLRWSPLKASCNTSVLYSVRYQGDFERLIQNGSWMDAAECQRIPVARCDLTFDLGSDSDYVLQVRAQCGPQLSDWTEVSFNRKDTTLSVPEMTVTTTGDVLQVTIKELPLTATASVTVWKEDDEQQADVFSMVPEEEVLHVAGLQGGAVYCLKAQVVLHTGVRSEYTNTHCVSISDQGPPPWKKPTTVMATVVVMLGLLVGLFWSIVHCRPESCKAFFQKEQLPDSLKGNWDTQLFIDPQREELREETLSVSMEKT